MKNATSNVMPMMMGMGGMNMPQMMPQMMNMMPMMMPMMNGMNMMPQMMGMMPQMMPMMNGMNMMPQMMNMMPQMMMGMTCEMSGGTMVCKMTPMGNMTKEMMMECCERMNSMMEMGMPVMMMCGNMMMCCCMPSAK